MWRSSLTNIAGKIITEHKCDKFCEFCVDIFLEFQ